jgi:hypothetical protein
LNLIVAFTVVVCNVKNPSHVLSSVHGGATVTGLTTFAGEELKVLCPNTFGTCISLIVFI